MVLRGDMGFRTGTYSHELNIYSNPLTNSRIDHHTEHRIYRYRSDYCLAVLVFREHDAYYRTI